MALKSLALRVVDHEEPDRLILKKSYRLDLTKKIDRRPDLFIFYYCTLEFDSKEE